MTDLHYLDQSLFDEGKAFVTYSSNGDGRLLKYNNEIIDTFVAQMIKIKPDILIISGDLTNNGEKISHIKLAEKLEIIEHTAGTRIYVIPGNHDIQNSWARSFVEEKQLKTDTVSWTTFSSIYKNYGYNEAELRDKNSLSYLAMPSEDLWLLMLDTNIYSKTIDKRVPYSNGTLQTETMKWIKICTTLAKEKGARIVTVMHHNLLNHNPLFSDYTIDNNEDVIKLFYEADIDLVLSGHLHIQDIQSHTNGTKTLYDIVTSSLLMTPFQYGILKYQVDQGFDYETKQIDVSEWANDQKLINSDLLNFNTFSSNYFKQLSYLKAYQALFNTESYTESEMELMADAMSDLNLYYFAGTTNLIRDRFLLSHGYRLWLYADEPEFLREYVLSMVDLKLYDGNKLHIN